MLITNSRRDVQYYAPESRLKIAWECAECLPSGWLPTDLTPTIIRWIRTGSETPTFPLFDSWVAELRSRVPAPMEHETDLSRLAQSVAHLREVEPAGIIFHVSRCGSTLLSNALSAGEDVFSISEAPAIDKAAQLPASGGPRAASANASVLRDLCRVFGHYRTSSPPRLIIKTGMAGVTRLRTIRSVWPKVPCVMLVRAPIEVVVSNLQNPPRVLLDWYDSPSTCFAPIPDEVLVLGVREFCAWLIGQICSEALEQMDDNCMLLDYRDLTPDAALRIAEFFSLPLCEEGTHALRKAFLFNAKRGGEFRPDADRKKKAATASLAESVSRWATWPYEDLLRSRWRLRVA